MTEKSKYADLTKEEMIPMLESNAEVIAGHEKENNRLRTGWSDANEKVIALENRSHHFHTNADAADALIERDDIMGEMARENERLRKESIVMRERSNIREGMLARCIVAHNNLVSAHSLGADFEEIGACHAEFDEIFKEEAAGFSVIHAGPGYLSGHVGSARLVVDSQNETGGRDPVYQIILSRKEA